jgi:hypothetical protein
LGSEKVINSKQKFIEEQAQSTEMIENGVVDINDYWGIKFWEQRQLFQYWIFVIDI